MKIEIEIRDEVVRRLCNRKRVWFHDGSDEPMPDEETIANYATTCLEQYAHFPERLTDEHKAAMILVRSHAMEQAVRVGKGDIVREADSIMRRLLENRDY